MSVAFENGGARIHLHSSSMDDYKKFLAIKQLPTYAFTGRTASFPREYAARIGVAVGDSRQKLPYEPNPALFDFQRDISAMAIDKGKFCLFEDCGLGKTIQELEFARHSARCLPAPKCVLIVAPLMVIPQTLQEAERFYRGELAIDHLHANNLQDWLTHGTARIGIVNFEALYDGLSPGRLGGLVIDESSMLKSHYGIWGRVILDLGRGLDWKLAGTGTPAPNDRIEYANHAVFMDAFPNVNAFLARFFVNRGQTQERWSLKAHAIRPFYRALSHWSIFLSNPGKYGWKDMSEPLPPIHTNIHHVPMTGEQIDTLHAATGMLLPAHAGGICSRSTLGQIAKGRYRGEDVATNKNTFIRGLVDSWPAESTLIWCIFNAEQDSIKATFPEAGSIAGDTPMEERLPMISDFKAGKLKTLITKPKVLGFGLNLQVATRQVFSGLQDSYESYYQAVKRSNRYGAKYPLNVHIPLTDLERPMVETVLEKADRVHADTEAQEAIFMEIRNNVLA